MAEVPKPFKTNARRGRDKDRDSDKRLYLANAASGERPQQQIRCQMKSAHQSQLGTGDLG